MAGIKDDGEPSRSSLEIVRDLVAWNEMPRAKRQQHRSFESWRESREREARQK